MIFYGRIRTAMFTFGTSVVRVQVLNDRDMRVIYERQVAQTKVHLIVADASSFDRPFFHTKHLKQGTYVSIFFQQLICI